MIFPQPVRTMFGASGNKTVPLGRSPPHLMRNASPVEDTTNVPTVQNLQEIQMEKM
jgi:hypothetical protein